MSSAEQPITVRFTKSRDEIVALLEELAHDAETRARFRSEPQSVLEHFGIEITPADAIPRIAIVPTVGDIERALEVLSDLPGLWPWIHFFPWVGVVSPPDDDDGETPYDDGDDGGTTAA